jgi:hypothetical protein
VYLCKCGITVEVTHPTDIKRYKNLGYVEAEVGYPNPEVIVDGKPVEKPVKTPKAKASTPVEKPAKEKAVNDAD